jgi:hypothetical protein
VHELNTTRQDYRNLTMTKTDDGVLLALKIHLKEATEQVFAKMLQARCSCNDSSSDADVVVPVIIGIQAR